MSERKCRFCGRTDGNLGRDDRGEEAGWLHGYPDVCTKPGCLTRLRFEAKRTRRTIAAQVGAAVRPIRSRLNQAAKRKRERREKKAQQRKGGRQ